MRRLLRPLLGLVLLLLLPGRAAADCGLLARADPLKRQVCRLGSADVAVRRQALRALATMGGAAVEALVRAARHPNAQVRGLALVALFRQPQPPSTLLALLQQALRDPVVAVRLKAVVLLGLHGERHPAALVALRTALGDSDARVRRAAFDALRSNGLTAETLVPLALFGPDDMALRAIGELARLPGATATALLRYVAADTSRASSVRRAATQGLRARQGQSRLATSKGDPANAALTAALSSGDPRRRVAAARVVQQVRKAPARAVAALVQALGAGSAEEREVASQALLALGPKVVPVLLPALSGSSEERRAAACWVVGQLGPAARRVLPQLEQRLVDPKERPYVRMFAAQALGHMGPPAVAPLRRALSHPLKLVRMLSAETLGQLGAEAAAARRALRRVARSDRERVVRRAARSALKQLRNAAAAGSAGK